MKFFVKMLRVFKIKKLNCIFCGFFFVLSLLAAPVVSYAKVSFTTETLAGNDTVFIAGNPGCYPVEYYNSETKVYEGIMPLIYERISEITDIDFTYINVSEEDNRMRMAENCRVEIISCCTQDDLMLETLNFSPALFTYENGTITEEIRIAYTDLASETLKLRMEQALEEISEKEISEMLLSYSMGHDRKSVNKNEDMLLYVLGAFLLVVMIGSYYSYRRIQKKNQEVMTTDILTGIGNRDYFKQCFKDKIAEKERSRYIVAYIGFDIEKVRSYYGEKEAKEQICFAAKDLLDCLEKTDFAGRVEEGAIAIAHVWTGEESVENWINRILVRLNKYCSVYGEGFCPYFCAGIYRMKDYDNSGSVVLGNARLGLNQALEQGIPYVIITEEQVAGEKKRRQLLNSVKEAMDLRQLKLYLQCIVKGDNGEICGAEALSRWNHPQRGVLKPVEYVPVLESEGKIFELDFYMFEATCAQLQYWEKQGYKLWISCNISRTTLGRKDFVEQIKKILNKYVFAHDRLILELTEDTFEINRVNTFHNIKECQEMGFRIALDDVGSGYTSFSDLRDYPVDIVKIDSSILGNAIDNKGEALLNGMITLAHSLGIDVLCEGVETEKQYELLRNMNCDYMQGFYFYRAVPSTRVEKYLCPDELFV